MRSILTRLLGIGVVLGIGWFFYQMDDVRGCDGPGSSDWFDATNARLDEATADYQSWDEYTTTEEFSDYAVRAEARYQAQQSQKTVKCLETLQGHAVEFFRLEWKMYEAASEGNFELAHEYDLESIDADDAAANEFDRLAEEYDWEVVDD
jgi:hypothetical protein